MAEAVGKMGLLACLYKGEPTLATSPLHTMADAPEEPCLNTSRDANIQLISEEISKPTSKGDARSRLDRGGLIRTGEVLESDGRLWGCCGLFVEVACICKGCRQHRANTVQPAPRCKLGQ